VHTHLRFCSGVTGSSVVSLPLSPHLGPPLSLPSIGARCLRCRVPTCVCIGHSASLAALLGLLCVGLTHALGCALCCVGIYSFHAGPSPPSRPHAVLLCLFCVTAGSILCRCWVYSVSLLGLFCVTAGSILCRCWVYSVSLLGLFCVAAGSILCRC